MIEFDINDNIDFPDEVWIKHFMYDLTLTRNQARVHVRIKGIPND